MIVINSGKMQIPEEERFIGFFGDNLHSTRQFRLTDISEPDCIYRLYLTFDDGTVNYFVLDSKVENSSTILTWNILEEHIFKSGTVQAQIKCIGADGEIYHTTCDYFIVASSAEDAEFFSNKENSEFLRYERMLNSILSSINSNGDVFVPTGRKIADLNLSKDITVKELQTALSTYPIMTTMYEPTTALKGETGQLCVGGTHAEDYKLYMCFGKNSSGEYRWKLIADGGDVDIDLSEYVKTDRTIADIDLSSNITKYDLQKALETYPVKIWYTDLGSPMGEVGQLAVDNFHKGNPRLRICTKKEETGEIDQPYICTWEEIGVGSVDLSDYVPSSRTIADLDLTDDITVEELKTALGNIPVRTTTETVDSSFAGEVGEMVLYRGGVTNVYICASADIENNIYRWVQISNKGFVPFSCVNNATINSDYVGTEGQIVINYENGKRNVYMCVDAYYAGDDDTPVYVWVKLNEDLSDYVKNSLTIAGVDLKDNITADELNDALGIVSKAGENIFEYSEDNLLVGYSTSGGSIGELLDTLELSVDNTTNVRETPSYTLYRKIIPVLQGSDYALSDTFRGYIRLYDASGANLSVVSVTDNNPLLGGENYGILTIPEDVSYITLNFMNSGNVDFSTFKIVQGTQAQEKTTLNSDIKVSYNQLIDVPDFKLSDEDKLDIANLVIQMMNAQSGDESDV